MNRTEELLNEFYSSFSKGDYNGMINCYHEDIEFSDPAFGTLKGQKAMKMWEMLLSAKESKLEISYKVIFAHPKKGKVKWIASYNFGPSKRKIINKVTATLEVKDDKIFKHVDQFNLWKWSIQALGIPGYLLGWTSFMKKKVQQKANSQLNHFMNS